jgi:hypothetical protein
MRSLPHGHVAAALGMLRKLGLDDLLAEGQRQRARMVALVTALVVVRRRQVLLARVTWDVSHLRDDWLPHLTDFQCRPNTRAINTPVRHF